LPSDAISQKRVELGRKLFFDAAVGIDGKTSCATCHLPERYGAETAAKSLGVLGRAHIHNAPTVFNCALQLPEFLGLLNPDDRLLETTRRPERCPAENFVTKTRGIKRNLSAVAAGILQNLTINPTRTPSGG